MSPTNLLKPTSNASSQATLTTPAGGGTSEFTELARAELVDGVPEGLNVSIGIPRPNLRLEPTQANSLLWDVSTQTNVTRVFALVQYGSILGGANQFLVDVGSGMSVYVPAKWVSILVAANEALALPAQSIAVACQISKSEGVKTVPPAVRINPVLSAATPNLSVGIPPFAKRMFAMAFDTATFSPDSFQIRFTSNAATLASKDYNVGDPLLPVDVSPFTTLSVRRNSLAAFTNVNLTFEIEP